MSRGGSGGKSVGRESRPSKSGGELLAHTARRRSLSLARPCQYGTNRHKPQLNRRRAILLKIISISRQFAFLRTPRRGTAVDSPPSLVSSVAHHCDVACQSPAVNF